MATPLTEDQIREQLRSVKYPGFSRDIVSFGVVQGVTIEGGEVELSLKVTSRDRAVPEQIQEEAARAVARLDGVENVKISVQFQSPETAQAESGAVKASPIAGVKHTIAVASGKGGVGKSTVASNLAAALSRQGKATGLLDCDLYGPSVALMFGTRERPSATADQMIVPIEQYGIRLMSMGFLLEDTSPVIVRGPMAHKYTQQFLRQVEWGELDYLILDLPPGTGDVQLSIVQNVALSGAVLVSTPQEVALIDARKAAAMFEKVNVSVLGLVENMSYFLCPGDGQRYDIFGSGGGEREAKRLKVPLLGQVPIDIATREGGDRGKPIVLSEPDGAVAQEFMKISQEIEKLIRD